MNYTLCIIGLGYVGLPLAVEFSKKFKVIGFDIDSTRITELSDGYDRTKELTNQQLKHAKGILYSSNIEDIREANIFIVTVPTPIDKHNEPDLSPLISACNSISKYVKKGDIVIFESTVYPGVTEEICVPIIEKNSNLKFNKEFFCGYSPERINPGDKVNRLRNIKKVTSGSTVETAEIVDKIYAEIIDAGTYKAPSIKVAEAAKVIENTQRDINIALINELALIFDKLNLSTEEVLKAAETKWNFLPFRPGLVGGHCIGVDPYYLTFKALEVGYNPEMILSGRRINNNISSHVVNSVTKLMIQKRINVIDSKILIMGFTFKEDCPDIRNTKVSDIVSNLKDLNVTVDIYDPVANPHEINAEYGYSPIKEIQKDTYDAIIIAVAHNEFKQINISTYRSFLRKNGVIYDVKYALPEELSDGRL